MGCQEKFSYTLGGPVLGLFGARVREGREAKRKDDGKHWTQRDLADAVGVDENTVGNWESGRTEPSIPTKRAVAAALGVLFEWVNGEIESDYRVVTVDRSATVVRDESRSFYQSPPQRLPPRAYELVYGYLDQLERAGFSEDEVDWAKEFLTNTAYNKINARGPGERSEEELIIGIKAGWVFIKDMARSAGRSL